MSSSTQAPLGTQSITLKHDDHVIIDGLDVTFPAGKVTFSGVIAPPFAGSLAKSMAPSMST